MLQLGYQNTCTVTSHLSKMACCITLTAVGSECTQQVVTRKRWLVKTLMLVQGSTSCFTVSIGSQNAS